MKPVPPVRNVDIGDLLNFGFITIIADYGGDYRIQFATKRFDVVDRIADHVRWRDVTEFGSRTQYEAVDENEFRERLQLIRDDVVATVNCYSWLAGVQKDERGTWRGPVGEIQRVPGGYHHVET